METRRVRPAMAAILAVALTVALSGPAGADQRLTITGDATSAESAEITEQWERFTAVFGEYRECLLPIEVMVVARAEDWYGGRNVGPIAAFYDADPVPMVVVEHRKVVAQNLLHEFAHHLDLSCGIGAGPVGEALRAAQGIPSERGWFTGTSWEDVPAEVFAETVVAFFGEPTQLAIEAETIELVAGIAGVPATDAAKRSAPPQDEVRQSTPQPGPAPLSEPVAPRRAPRGVARLVYPR